MADGQEIQPVPTPDTPGGVGGALLDRIGRRAVLRTLQSALRRGLHVGDVGLAKAIATAEVIIDDDKATHRDKLRASEFLKAVTDRGIDVALAATKNDVEAGALAPRGPIQINIYPASERPKPPPIVAEG